MRTMLVFGIVALLALAACAQHTTNDEAYRQYCTAGIAEVYDCGSYVKAVYGNLGGGIRWYDAATGDLMDCPVVAPDAMTPGCKALQDREENMTCEQRLDCAQAGPDQTETPRLAVCNGAAAPNGFRCVDACPDGYDSYGTQMGLDVCIRHLGAADFSRMPQCATQQDCEAGQHCVLTSTATDGTPVPDATFRCVPQQYYDYGVQHGLTTRDAQGRQGSAIA